MNYKVRTPVVMIVFNRFEKTLQVFEKVKLVQPLKLYIIADGPRIGNSEDLEKCSKVRAIFDKIDWPCEVIKDYSSNNLGCAIRVFSGISSVFKKEKLAIILEDDCLPDLTFFRFCDEMLNKYIDDKRIMLVSGTNIKMKWGNNNTYHFSKSGGIHGWASWRRSWDLVDINISLWKDTNTKRLLKNKSSKRFYQSRSYIYDKLVDNIGNADTWDYQFSFARSVNNGLAIVPSVNLISNVGYDEESTHNFNNNSKTANLPTFPLQFPLNHPKIIVEDVEYDKLLEDLLYPRTFKGEIQLILKKVLNIYEKRFGNFKKKQPPFV